MSYPIGETKPVYITAGSNTAELLRPPPGTEWFIHLMFARHGQATAQNINWWITNPDYYKDIHICEIAAAQWEKVYLNTYEDSLPHQDVIPWRFTHDSYPYCTGGGTGFYDVQGFILERPANTELILLEWQSACIGKDMPAPFDALKWRIEHYRSGIL